MHTSDARRELSAAAPERPEGQGPIPLRAWQGGDDVLLSLLRDRHPDAAAILFDRFEPQVNRLIWRLLGADPDHDDLVQQTFLHALRAAPGLLHGDNLRAWVCAIAVNLVRSELRRRKVRRLFGLAAGQTEEPALDPPDPERAERVARARALLAGLTTEERLAFVLRHVEERSLPETAAMMRSSPATVKRRLASAAAKLAPQEGAPRSRPRSLSAEGQAP